ncbi:MAG: hypothetical protein OIF57_13955 [Marinobacterium sp.]|nr:hypothetical protein [Marinobacterium sp.]
MSYIQFDFDTPEKSLKKIQARFEKAGLTVTETVADEKPKRKSGYPTKEMKVFFSDGQTVSISMKSTGDVFQVKLNSTVLPVQNTTNLSRALDEIARKIEKNAPAWLKAQRRKQARQKVNDADVKPRVVTSRKKQTAEAQQTVDELQAQADELQAEQDTMTTTLNGLIAEAEALEKQIKEVA